MIEKQRRAILRCEVHLRVNQMTFIKLHYKVHLRVDVHLARVDLEDTCTSRFARQRELDLPVDATGAEQGGIENVHAIRRGDHLP